LIATGSRGWSRFTPIHDHPRLPVAITLDQVEDVLVATLESMPENATH